MHPDKYYEGNVNLVKEVVSYRSPTQGASRMNLFTARNKFGKHNVEAALQAGLLRHDTDAGTLFASKAGVKALGGKRVFNDLRRAGGASLSAKTAAGRAQLRAQGKPVGPPQVVIGPQGGVYERGKSGKLHSAGPAVRAAHGGGRRK